MTTTAKLRFTFYTNGKPDLEARAVNFEEIVRKLKLIVVEKCNRYSRVKWASVIDTQGNTYTIRW